MSLDPFKSPKRLPGATTASSRSPREAMASLRERLRLRREQDARTLAPSSSTFVPGTVFNAVPTQLAVSTKPPPPNCKTCKQYLHHRKDTQTSTGRYWTNCKRCRDIASRSKSKVARRRNSPEVVIPPRSSTYYDSGLTVAKGPNRAATIAAPLIPPSDHPEPVISAATPSRKVTFLVFSNAHKIPESAKHAS